MAEWLNSGQDPRESSRQLLESLKAQVDAIEDVPPLNQWWKKHAAEVARLQPNDLETLKLHCAERKSLILGHFQTAA